MLSWISFLESCHTPFLWINFYVNCDRSLTTVLFLWKTQLLKDGVPLFVICGLNVYKEKKQNVEVDKILFSSLFYDYLFSISKIYCSEDVKLFKTLVVW